MPSSLALIADVFSLLKGPKMLTELGPCAFAGAERLLAGLLGSDLPVTEMGMDGLSGREAAGRTWLLLLSSRGAAQAVSGSEHMLLFEFTCCPLEMLEN